VSSSKKGGAAAFLMTEMGNDGAEGLGKLSTLGALTVAQTIDLCVRYLMPKSAMERG
jgi:chemotaxis response regulator CheB